MASIKDIEIKINANLVEALKHAVSIIESYELDIRNSKETAGVDLLELGFCQGSIYKTAVEDINKMIEGKQKPEEKKPFYCPFCMKHIKPDKDGIYIHDAVEHPPNFNTDDYTTEH